MEPMPRLSPAFRCFAALLSAVWCASVALAEKDGYRVIVDAGSTGSRLHVFQWQEGGLVEIKPPEDDEDLFRVTPGISSYVDSPELVGPSLHSMLVAAESYVPQEARADTPVYVMATAGIRRTNATEATKLLSEVDRYLQQPENNPFRLGEPSHVLSGVEEGVDALLSVNNLLGNSGLEVGILDLGGDSTQVAFRPNGSVLNFDTRVYVEGVLYSIYATSFSVLGNEATWQRALDSLAAHDAGDGEVEFPCYARGGSFTANITGGGEVAFRGTGDAQACSTLVTSLLHLDYECFLPPCSMAGRYMANVEGVRFYALNAFFYTALNLGLVEWDDTKVLMPAEIALAAEELCGKTKEQALAVSGQPWKYLEKGCLEGYNVYHMLTAYGFPAESTSITFTREIHGSSADWTAGALLFREFNPDNLDETAGEGAVDVAEVFGWDVWMVASSALGFTLAATCVVCLLVLTQRVAIGESRSVNDYIRGFQLCPGIGDEERLQHCDPHNATVDVMGEHLGPRS